jgi:ubiquinone/menaquinone biosynthesis C-methylase UbiE
MRTIAKFWWGLIQFGFYLLYNQLAWTYDLVSKVVSLGQWHSWQRTALNHLNVESGARILELAHGTGDLEIDLHDAGFHVIGYDLSPYMGQIAQRKLKSHGLKPQLVRGMAQKLPFPTAAFSAIVSTFPTNFIFAPETLKEAHRVLKPDGRLVIVPGGSLTGGSLAVKLIEWLYRITGQRGDEPYQQIIDFFNRNGFELQVIEEKLSRSRAWVFVATRKTL